MNITKDEDEFNLKGLGLPEEAMGPLRSAQEEVKRIEEELQKYLNEIVKANRQENQTDIAIKTNLKRRLLENRQRFLEEKKKALKTQKKLDEESMKDGDHEHCKNAFAMVICPQYTLNDELKIYTEDSRPPETVFKAVGYNNLEIVKKMMQGDDAEKRSGMNVGTQISESARNRNAMLQEEKKA
jgi:BMFP domain-containing protein YqiC